MEKICNKDALLTKPSLWKEEGRSYVLEKRRNEEGNFLLYAIWDADSQRHILIFPEGKAQSYG